MKPISHQIVRWLPHLRRHAHAVTGSRTRGDSYVMACLSVLAVEPERLSDTGDVRVELHKLFHAMWQMVDREYPSADAEPAAEDLILCEGLAQIPPLSRQVLLLVSMEGFSVAETATITGLSEARVATLLREARAQIRGRLQYTVPLDMYRQPQARRALQRPSVRRHGGEPARSVAAHPGERPAPVPAWSWPT
jgi:DNA-directed RNA polymerase specialized sigma24 family protein